MNMTMPFKITGLLVGLFTLSSCSQEAPIVAAGPAVTVQPGGAVNRVNYEKLDELADPDSPHWAAIQEYQVDLATAPPVHPSVMLRYDPQSQPVPLSFRVASDDENFTVLMTWPDDSRDVENTFEKFSDSAAVQFALSGGAQTSYMMGSPDAPVNIWYWKGNDDQGQNLNAGGFGSTSYNDDQSVTVTGSYSEDNDGEWRVVFSAPLAAANEYQADLSGNTPIYLSFAVWQGNEKQRDGAKHITMGWLSVEQPEVL